MAEAGDPLLRARRLIDADATAAVTLREVAAAAGLSRHHCLRSFRERFGVTPGRYRRRLRLEEAKRLLRDTEMPVTEVCLAAGFTSLGTFSRVFRALTGLPPSRFRHRWQAHRRWLDRPHARAIPACMLFMFAPAVDSNRGEAEPAARR